LLNYSQFKTGILHPDHAVKYLSNKGKTGILYPVHAVKYLFNKDFAQIDLAKKYIENYFENYKSIRDYNKKNSKYSLRFDFCKRILTDSISDESIREKFFEDSNNLSDSEISKAMKEEPNPLSLAAVHWPKRAHTMLGLMRLENLQFCVEETIRNNVQGDLIETGVWRGGATIFMRFILQKYTIKDKIVYVADSFEGLPKPNAEEFPEDYGDKNYTSDELKVSLEEVKNNFKKYGVFDEQVKFIKGFFEDTMKNSSIEKLSLLRLDGDMYGSTWVVLENLYDKLSLNGYLIIDDYILKSCRKAVLDFRKMKNIQHSIIPIDDSCIYWKK